MSVSFRKQIIGYMRLDTHSMPIRITKYNAYYLNSLTTIVCFVKVFQFSFRFSFIRGLGLITIGLMDDKVGDCFLGLGGGFGLILLPNESLLEVVNVFIFSTATAWFALPFNITRYSCKTCHCTE